MTREGWRDSIVDFDDLVRFCLDENIDLPEDLFNEEMKDDYFNDSLVDMASRADDWREMYDMLREIPDGAEYYRYNEVYGCLEIADSYDLDEYRDFVEEILDKRGFWGEREEPSYSHFEDSYEREETFEIESEENLFAMIEMVI